MKMEVWRPDFEGYVNVLGLRIFYRVFGESGSKGTVLCLHGGPGCASDYMLSLTDLTRFGYKVVLYDQMGTGRSQLPINKSLLTVEQHVQEIEGVRNALNLGKVHLFGHSWGATIAIEYTAEYQPHLKSLILSSPLTSTPAWLEGTNKLRSKLPRHVQVTLSKHEATGNYKNQDYIEASWIWYRKHFCRLPAWPAEVQYAVEQCEGPVYQTMWGPNEFVCTGTLRYCDVENRFSTIKVPCLLAIGDFDELEPSIINRARRAIRGSKLVTFRGSGHMSMWDAREENVSAVAAFLNRH